MAAERSYIFRLKGDAEALVATTARAATGLDNLATTTEGIARQQAAAGAAGDRFIASLRSQVEAAGKSESQLLQMRAAQLGVAESATPLIASIEARRQAEARDAEATQRATAAQTALANIRAAVAAQERNQYQAKQQFIASLEREVASIGKSRTELLALKAAELGVTEQTSAMIAKLSNASALKGGEQALHGITVSAGQTKAALRQLPSQFTDIVTQLAGGQNPLLILVQQGGQIKDSFGGLGPTFTALRAAINPTTVAIAAVGAGLAFLGYAAYTGQQQLAEFNKSMVLTGNYAGVTVGQMHALSGEIAAAANVTRGAARDALQEVVSTGAFGPALLQPVSVAVARMAEITGESAEKIAAEFATMGSGVAKYAAEHNKSMHLITAAQYEQIKALEEAGKAEQAQAVYIGALNTRLAEHDKSIGAVARAWQDAKKWASDYFSWVQGTFQPTTVDRQLVLAQSKIAGLQAILQNPQAPADVKRKAQADLAEQNDVIAALQRSKALADQVAKATADSDKRQAEGIAGSQVVDAIKKEIDKRSEATKKVQEYTVAVQKMRAANDPNAPSAKEEAAAIALINEKYKTKGQRDAEKLDTRYQDRLVALTAEGIKLDAETKNYELYGRSIDKSRVALLDLEVAQGKLKGLDPARIAQLRAIAAADDAKDVALDQAKLNAELDKRITRISAQANAQAMNSREVQVANELATAQTAGLVKGTAAYDAYEAKLRTAINAEHDQVLQRTLAAQQLENDTAVQKLDEETRLLGLSTLERERAVAVMRLQAQAQKDIAANPGQTAQILDAMVTKQNALTDAIDRSYVASRQFDTGVSTALQKYREDATNSGAAAERAIGGGLQRAEDVLVDFVKTGKLRFGDLWRFMADEFIRQQARMLIAQQTGSGSILSDLFKVIGGGFSAYDSSGYGITGASTGGQGLVDLGLGGGRAGGGMVAAGSLHPVDELGPELLTQDGKDYLMVGGKGGYITPLSNRASGSGGGQGGRGGGVNITYKGESEPRVTEARQDDDGTWHLFMAEAVRQTKSAIAGEIASGYGQVPKALRGRGVSLNASNPRKN